MSRKLANLVMLTSLVIIFMCTTMVKADIVQDGLISYYSFDTGTIDGDNVEDSWGDNDGVIAGGVEVVPGKIGNALEFDGVVGKVDIAGGDDSLNFNGVEEFTVAAWLFRNGDSGGTCCGSIIAQRDLNGWALRYDNRNAGNETELIISPGWVGDGGSGVPLPEGEWHYIVGVLGDKNIQIYVDGEIQSETAFASGAVATSGGTATVLGGASDGYFNGIIDEALIYSRALTADEVVQNFESSVFYGVEPGGKLAISWGELKKQS